MHPSAPELAAVLTYALLRNGPLSTDLYHEQLEAYVETLLAELHEDEEDFSFAVAVERNQVAMVLVHIDGIVAINKAARTALQTIWQLDYQARMEQHIPQLIKGLSKDDFAVISVKMLRS